MMFLTLSVFLSLFLSPASSFTPLQSRPSLPRFATRKTSTTSLDESLNPSETAVLFTKYQNDFASENGKLNSAVKPLMEATKMLSNSKALLAFCRQAGVTVIHCPISTEPGQSDLTLATYGVLERIKSAEAVTFGEWGANICDEMMPVDGDIISPKYGMCAFSTTELDGYLRSQGIKNVIVAGFLTNGSVESTVRTAYERCYTVFVPPDCCAATSFDEHNFSLNLGCRMFAHLVSSAELMQALSSA